MSLPRPAARLACRQPGRTLAATLFLALAPAAAACAGPVGLAPSPAAPATELAAASPPPGPSPTAGTAASPEVHAYDLGDTTLTQARFPADSRFRDMPARLNGIIAAPKGEGGPYPVVLVLHGTHPGCPVPEGDMVDRWPCAPETEQPNYRGFAPLLRALAEQGYVALSININAENTLGFGEPVAGERLGQLVAGHLGALAEANAGGENDFGLPLAGRADLGRLALIGHSRGGEAAYWLAHEGGLGEAASASGQGYGPAAGVLMVAPAMLFVDATAGSRLPLAVILPSCDGDIIDQHGKAFYEFVRRAEEQPAWVTSAWLEEANHNAFNELLPQDFMAAAARQGRPDCQRLLDPEAQRDFLADYAADFLTTIFDADPERVAAAGRRLGMDAGDWAPDRLHGLPARASVLPAAAERETLLVPITEAELGRHRGGGPVTAEGLTARFCPEGYYTQITRPELAHCHRGTVEVPGQPALALVSWPEPGAIWRFALPEGQRDVSDFSAIGLRAAVDPLAPENESGRTQGFSVRLTDGSGATASVPTRATEPALAFPPGEVQEDETFGQLFAGRAPMTMVRIPLAEFRGVDLGDIRELALVFDQRPSGALFLGDLGWVGRSP